MHSSVSEGEPINSFALVGYIPDPLGSFLDRLRSELVLGCTAQSHVTLLPPRPLSAPPEQAWSQLKGALAELSALDLELGEIEVFPITNVIYISIKRGFAELQALHGRLNEREMAFLEPFEYHPHVTLAQEIPGCEVPAVLEIARRRWREWGPDRRVLLETLTFVQNTIQTDTGASRWIDLAEIELPKPVRVG